MGAACKKNKKKNGPYYLDAEHVLAGVPPQKGQLALLPWSRWVVGLGGSRTGFGLVGLGWLDARAVYR